tara:strand:- start:676 stop:900 length:225 start_codon:yes stop_codon:yes gene_type:complete
LPADDCRPLKLKAVRQHLVDDRLCRTEINKRIGRIKWAVSKELVQPSIHEGLKTVGGLKYSRTAAREYGPIKPE